MISDEEDEHVMVTGATYKAIIKPGGGAFLVIIIQLIMILFVVCNIGANYYIQKWAYADIDEQKDRFKFYFIIVFAFSFGMGIFILMRVALLMLA